MADIKKIRIPCPPSIKEMIKFFDNSKPDLANSLRGIYDLPLKVYHRPITRSSMGTAENPIIVKDPKLDWCQ